MLWSTPQSEVWTEAFEAGGLAAAQAALRIEMTRQRAQTRTDHAEGHRAMDSMVRTHLLEKVARGELEIPGGGGGGGGQEDHGGEGKDVASTEHSADVATGVTPTRAGVRAGVTVGEAGVEVSPFWNEPLMPYTEQPKLEESRLRRLRKLLVGEDRPRHARQAAGGGARPTCPWARGATPA